MTIQVHKSKSYTLHPMDVEFVYEAVLRMIDNLENFRKWTDIVDKKHDMYNSNASENINEEIRALKSLSMDIYETVYRDASFTKTVEYNKE